MLFIFLFTRLENSYDFLVERRKSGDGSRAARRDGKAREHETINIESQLSVARVSQGRRIVHRALAGGGNGKLPPPAAATSINHKYWIRNRRPPHPEPLHWPPLTRSRGGSSTLPHLRQLLDPLPSISHFYWRIFVLFQKCFSGSLLFPFAKLRVLQRDTNVQILNPTLITILFLPVTGLKKKKFLIENYFFVGILSFFNLMNEYFWTVVQFWSYANLLWVLSAKLDYSLLKGQLFLPSATELASRKQQNCSPNIEKPHNCLFYTYLHR